MIPHDRGLDGHSDADALCHAIMDAVLGAAGLGDIGRHFPDTDPQWRGASSIGLLKHIIQLVAMEGFEVMWIDSTIIAEAPKLAPHVDAMKEAIATTDIPKQRISIKATSNEGMGFIGRSEGIAVIAACTLKKRAS